MSATISLSKTLSAAVARQKSIALDVIKEKEKLAQGYAEYSKAKNEYEELVLDSNILNRKINTLQEGNLRQEKANKKILQEIEDLQISTEGIRWQQTKAKMVLDQLQVHQEKYINKMNNKLEKEKQDALETVNNAVTQTLKKNNLEELKKRKEHLANQILETTVVIAKKEETYVAYKNKIATLPNKNQALEISLGNDLKNAMKEKEEVLKQLSELQDKLECLNQNLKEPA